jgi:hypothetical protein
MVSERMQIVPFIQKDTRLYAAQLMRGMFPGYSDRLGRINMENVKERDHVYSTLEEFSKDVNKQEVTRLVHAHKSQNGVLYDETFKIQPCKGHGPVYPAEYGVPENLYRQSGYSDGELGFFLGVKKDDTLRWLSLLSFNTRAETAEDLEIEDIVGQMPSAPDALTVVQLQAVEKGSQKTERNMLAQFQWGYVMLSLFLTWAQRQQISCVDVVPGEYNTWLSGEDDARKQIFLQRYDTPARNIGFRRQLDAYKQPIGLYTYPLSYPNFHLGTK